MVIAVTGTNGYVGGCVMRRLRERGHKTLEFRRLRAGEERGDALKPYSLEGGAEIEDLRGVEALVHCAYDFRPSRWADIERVNARGAEKLFRAASEAGVGRLVLISTMSAFDGCASMYGKAKLLAESAARETFGVSGASGAAIIRPGLVFGGRLGGMMGALEKVVGVSPVVPLIGSGRQTLYLTHYQDLCSLVEYCLAAETAPAEPVIAANERGLTFREILRMVAEAKGKTVAFAPVPWRLVWAALRTAETLGLPLGLRSDSVVSLVRQNERPDMAPTRRTGVAFREFAASALQ